MVLISPVQDEKMILLSPVYQTRGESRFVIIAVDTISADAATQDNCRALQLQNNIADRHTAELARQITCQTKAGGHCQNCRGSCKDMQGECLTTPGPDLGFAQYSILKRNTEHPTEPGLPERKSKWC